VISNNFAYGYGGTRLGTGTAYVDWYLTNSTYFDEAADFTLTSSSSTAVFSGALSNGARGVSGGGRVLQNCIPRASGAHGPSVTIYSAKPYCVEGDNTSYDHNMTSEMSWYISGYPGYWYVFERSVVAHTPSTGPNAFYAFDPVNYLPGNFWGNGYNPNG
jgi:hypothetical protein